MDVEAACGDLERFMGVLGVMEQVETNVFSELGISEDVGYMAARSEVNLNRSVIEAIAEDFGSDYPVRIRNALNDGPASQALMICQQLFGAITKVDRIKAIVGTPGPKLAAVGMHPWVWIPAAKQWDEGNRRDAIQRACTSVFDTELRSKANRYDMQTLDLVGHVFNITDPSPGDVRLRLPGYDKATPEWRDVHKGARDFGLGCVAAIRNLVTHGLDEPEQDTALEVLASLSLFARWVDDAEPEFG
jgi:hypothetical protein